MPCAGLTSEANRLPFEVCNAVLKLLISAVTFPSAQKFVKAGCTVWGFDAVESVRVGNGLGVLVITAGEVGGLLGVGEVRMGISSTVGVGIGLPYTGSEQPVASIDIRPIVIKILLYLYMLISFLQRQVVSLHISLYIANSRNSIAFKIFWRQNRKFTCSLKPFFSILRLSARNLLMTSLDIQQNRHIIRQIIKKL
jgi:hypothetical protein